MPVLVPVFCVSIHFVCAVALCHDAIDCLWSGSHPLGLRLVQCVASHIFVWLLPVFLRQCIIMEIENYLNGIGTCCLYICVVTHPNKMCLFWPILCRCSEKTAHRIWQNIWLAHLVPRARQKEIVRQQHKA